MPDGAPDGARDLLRFLACGAVDSGKSTLIGRLLFETGNVREDELAALVRDSKRYGTTGEEPDYALLLDGLEAEREQGITVDVAWRYFSTSCRRFIVADAPGHLQYTRNMASGAASASLAVLLVDARQGLQDQTRRHALICALFGIPDLVLAVNKMDAVGYDEAAFTAIADEFRAFAAPLGLRRIVALPLVARKGENVTRPAVALSWHDGPTLLGALEDAASAEALTDLPLRIQVQGIMRPDSEFRGMAGTVASGRVAPGDPVAVAGSGLTSRVARIVAPRGDLAEATAGQAVMLCLDDPIDVGRGDLLVAPDQRPAVAAQFAARLVALDEAPLLPGRRYALRIGHFWTAASITSIRHRLDVVTGGQHPARRLAMNEIGLCHLATTEPVPFDPYAENRATGSFILVDQTSHRTAAAGLIAHPLRRDDNIRRETFLVDKPARATLAGQRPAVIWFTGLSGSGKSTIAKRVEQELHQAGRHTYSLDGDNLRHGLCRDLGFTAEDRVENIRRAGEVAKLMVDAGLIVLCSFISPFRGERQLVRDMLEPGEFLEVFVDAPLDVCASRDPKGLYAKAMAGLIPSFTGIDSPYEAPEAPDLHLRTGEQDAAASVAAVLVRLRQDGFID